jgi:hypothetical protein
MMFNLYIKQKQNINTITLKYIKIIVFISEAEER